MNSRRLLWMFVAGLGATALQMQPVGSRLHAQGTSAVALRGHVSSAAEPSMEGVVVTAGRPSSGLAA